MGNIGDMIRSKSHILYMAGAIVLIVALIFRLNHWYGAATLLICAMVIAAVILILETVEHFHGVRKK